MADLDLTALWVSGANAGCPSCGVIEWVAGPVTQVPEFDPATEELNYENGFPAMTLICGNCFFVRFHAVELTGDEAPRLGMGGNGAAG
jgi:hypothetical protein